MKHSGNDASLRPRFFDVIKRGVVQKMEKKSLWSLLLLQRRLISGTSCAEVHGVACCAQRNGRITSAIGAAWLPASKSFASNLLIWLFAPTEAINESGAAADVVTGVQGLGDVAVA